MDQGGTDQLPEEFLKERTIDGFRPRVATRLGDTLVAVSPEGAVLGFCVACKHEIEQLFVSQCVP